MATTTESSVTGKSGNGKSGNGKLIGIIAGAIVALVAIVAIILVLVVNKKDVYRIVKVFEYEGDGLVTRQSIGDMEPYENMILESGDVVRLNTGDMTLKLDDDKYVYVEEQTEFELQASGSPEKSKTKINLRSGAIMNEIQNPLGDSASYEVNTPNSTMSVRGTIFRVEIYTDEDGVQYTKLSTFTGKVATNLINPDGTVSEDEVLIEAGKEVIIYEDDTVTDFLIDVRDIEYSELPAGVLEQLIEIVSSGDVELPITVEELEEYLEKAEEPGPFTVTYMYQGNVFGTQVVEKGECASKPSLMPASNGDWDFDFSTPIKKDTEIEWK